MTSAGASLHDVLRALDSAEVDPAPLEILPIRCASRYHGDLINGRFLKVPCRGSYCRLEGVDHTDHVFDLVTGHYHTVRDEQRIRHKRSRRNTPGQED